MQNHMHLPREEAWLRLMTNIYNGASWVQNQDLLKILNNPISERSEKVHREAYHSNGKFACECDVCNETFAHPEFG